MSEKPFDPKGNVRTRDGRAVRVIATDVRGRFFPIVALVSDELGNETVHKFMADGRWHMESRDHPLDLVNVPVRTSEFRAFADDGRGGGDRTYHVGGSSWDSLDSARQNTAFIGRTHIIELIREDGELVGIEVHPLTA